MAGTTTSTDDDRLRADRAAVMRYRDYCRNLPTNDAELTSCRETQNRIEAKARIATIERLQTLPMPTKQPAYRWPPSCEPIYDPDAWRYGRADRGRVTFQRAILFVCALAALRYLAPIAITVFNALIEIAHASGL